MTNLFEYSNESEKQKRQFARKLGARLLYLPFPLILLFVIGMTIVFAWRINSVVLLNITLILIAIAFFATACGFFLFIWNAEKKEISNTIHSEAREIKGLGWMLGLIFIGMVITWLSILLILFFFWWNEVDQDNSFTGGLIERTNSLIINENTNEITQKSKEEEKNLYNTGSNSALVKSGNSAIKSERFQFYKDINRDSNISMYKYGTNYITIFFKTWKNRAYTYSYQSAGKDIVEYMKILADQGEWLNAYLVSERPNYSQKN